MYTKKFNYYNTWQLTYFDNLARYISLSYNNLLLSVSIRWGLDLVTRINW